MMALVDDSAVERGEVGETLPSIRVYSNRGYLLDARCGIT
jgi:hypothetical protein